MGVINELSSREFINHASFICDTVVGLYSERDNHISTVFQLLIDYTIKLRLTSNEITQEAQSINMQVF